MGRGEGSEDEGLYLAGAVCPCGLAESQWGKPELHQPGCSRALPVDPLADLGMPRRMVDSPEGIEWNRGREQRFRDANQKLRELALQLALKLAKEETIPRGSYEGLPHSDYVNRRWPEIYQGLCRVIGEDSKFEAVYRTDKNGKQWRIVQVGKNWEENTKVVVIDPETDLTEGSFTLKHFEGGRSQIEQLWVDTADTFEVEKHALPGTWTADMVRYRLQRDAAVQEQPSA